MLISIQLPSGVWGLPVRGALVFVWPACPGSCVVSSLSSAWVTEATVHTHFQEKRFAVTSRHDRSTVDLCCHFDNTPEKCWRHCAVVFPGVYLPRLSTVVIWECDQVNLYLYVNLISRSRHTHGRETRGKVSPGRNTGCFCLGSFLLNGFYHDSVWIRKVKLRLKLDGYPPICSLTGASKR